jgi:opacity protein-like surface antigen
MRLRTAALCITALLLTQSATAQEPSGFISAEDRTGGSMNLMLGGSFCVEGSEANCNGIDPSFGMTIGASYRFTPYLGLAADFYYGMYDLEIDEIDSSSKGIVAGPRIYLPVGALDLILGAGIGWDNISASADSIEVSGNGLGISLMSGFEYRVSQNISLGLMARLNLSFIEEVCGSNGGPEICVDIDGNSHNAIIGATLGVHF